MKIGYLIIALLFPILLVVSRKEPGGWKERPARWLLRMTGEIRKKLGKKSSFGNKKVKEDLQFLHPEKTEEQQAAYQVRKLTLMLIVLFAGSFIAFCSSMQSRGTVSNIRFVNRSGYGSRKETKVITAVLETEEETIQKDVQIEVRPRQRSAKEAQAILEEVMEQFPEVILGDNEDVDHVSKKLNLIQEMKQGEVSITWESSANGLVDSKGNVYPPESEGELCLLTATFCCSGEERIGQFYVRVVPGEKTRGQLLIEELEQELKDREEASLLQEQFELPQDIQGNAVNWKKEESDNSVIFFLGTLLALPLLAKALDYDLHKKVNQRKEELLREYPDFVSRLVMLVGAGMTIRGAFGKMAEDYRGKREEKRSEIGEELLRTCNEMGSGISESKAYYHLGRRCKETHYIKLCMLLSQNLKKGTAGLLEILRGEAAQAFDERKRKAKKLGEEAGTKLLLPMMLMLVIVMVVIMVPAFWSFS